MPEVDAEASAEADLVAAKIDEQQVPDSCW
jgi:hypothetical protein